MFEIITFLFLTFQYAALTTPAYTQVPYQAGTTILQTVPIEVSSCHSNMFP